MAQINVRIEPNPVVYDELQPLCADRVRPADIGVARLEVVARRAPHHQRDPLPVLLEDEAHRVAP